MEVFSCLVEKKDVRKEKWFRIPTVERLGGDMPHKLKVTSLNLSIFVPLWPKLVKKRKVGYNIITYYKLYTCMHV